MEISLFPISSDYSTFKNRSKYLEEENWLQFQQRESLVDQHGWPDEAFADGEEKSGQVSDVREVIEGRADNPNSIDSTATTAAVVFGGATFATTFFGTIFLVNHMIS